MSFYTAKIFDCKSTRSKGTVFFVGPYTGKEVYFKPFFASMSAKFRVVYIQPKDSVLDYAHPENLEIAIKEVGEFITTHLEKPKKLSDKVKSKLEGNSHNYFVGCSIGSYFGYNLIPTLKTIDTYFFNATGAFVSHLVEDIEFQKILKTSHHTKQEIDSANKVWSKFEVAHLHGIKLRGKSIKLINSNNDKLVQKKYTKELFELADLRGADIQFEYTSLPGHQSQTLAINVYAKKIEKFIAASAQRRAHGL